MINSEDDMNVSVIHWVAVEIFQSTEVNGLILNKKTFPVARDGFLYLE